MKHILNNASEATDKPWIALDENGVHYSGNGAAYEMVDLGLPSGLLWAAYNIGATKPEEYGDYFMWGSTTPNTNTICDCEHAPYHEGVDCLTGWKKYNTEESCGDVDDKTILDPMDDAATQIWGADYRMPTEADFNELLANTNKEWVEDYNGSGVNGYLFRSQKDMDKYIFIPASSNRFESLVYGQGLVGYVWSSSLCSYLPFTGCILSFSSDDCFMDIGDRSCGSCVRPVSDK